MDPRPADLGGEEVHDFAPAGESGERLLPMPNLNAMQIVEAIHILIFTGETDLEEVMWRKHRIVGAETHGDSMIVEAIFSFKHLGKIGTFEASHLIKELVEKQLKGVTNPMVRADKLEDLANVLRITLLHGHTTVQELEHEILPVLDLDAEEMGLIITLLGGTEEDEESGAKQLDADDGPLGGPTKPMQPMQPEPDMWTVRKEVVALQSTPPLRGPVLMTY